MRTWCSPGGIGLLAVDLEPLEAEEVVAVGRPALVDVEAPAAERAALGDDHARRRRPRARRPAPSRRATCSSARAPSSRVSRPMPPNSSCELPRIELRAPGQVGVEALDAAVVERQHVVLAPPRSGTAAAARAASPAAPRRGRAPGSSRRARTAPRRRRRRRGISVAIPRDAVAGDGRPALVVDAAVARTSRSTASRGARRAPASSNVGPCSRPCSGICWTPCTNVGSGSPAASRIVGATSMTWWNWRGSRPRPRSRSASARSCRCGCRPSARRPAWSTGTACPSRAPSRRRSGCRPRACRTRRSATP